MEITVWALHVNLVVGDSTQAVGDGRNAGGELAAVAHHDAIAGQPVAVFGKIVFQCPAADLLLALDEELEIHRQPAFDGNPRLGAFDVREHLAFVVRRAAGIEFAVATGRLEGGGSPLFHRIGRLHVVMAVDQGRRGAGHRGRLGVDQRMARRRDHLGGKPKFSKLIGHPIGGSVHVVAMVRVGADARNAEKFAQFLLESCSVGIQILVDSGHGNNSPGDR